MDDKPELLRSRGAELCANAHRIDVAHVAAHQPDGFVGGEISGFGSKGFGMSRQHHGVRIQFEPAIGVGESLQQPAAEESGAAGDEDSLPAQRFPQTLGMGQDLVQIGGERRELGLGGHEHGCLQKA